MLESRPIDWKVYDYASDQADSDIFCTMPVCQKMGSGRMAVIGSYEKSQHPTVDSPDPDKERQAMALWHKRVREIEDGTGFDKLMPGEGVPAPTTCPPPDK